MSASAGPGGFSLLLTDVSSSVSGTQHLSGLMAVHKGCEGPDLAAWQAPVKVYVAQVFRRPLGQTHFVVIVNQPSRDHKEILKMMEEIKTHLGLAPI